MKKILSIIIIIALTASFFYGLSVGTYKIFPYEYLNSFKDDIELNQKITENLDIPSFDPSIIDIQNKSDILKIRDELIFYILE